MSDQRCGTCRHYAGAGGLSRCQTSIVNDGSHPKCPTWEATDE